MPEALNEVSYRLQRVHSRRPAKLKDKDEKEAGQRAAAPVPRISRLMALAIQLETSIAREDFDYGELARLGRVSRTRITQIMNLLLLAPDIQERLLFLPPVMRGRDVICEKNIRALAADYDWQRQRLAFELLLHSHESERHRNKNKPGREARLASDAK